MKEESKRKVPTCCEREVKGLCKAFTLTKYKDFVYMCVFGLQIISSKPYKALISISFLLVTSFICFLLLSHIVSKAVKFREIMGNNGSKKNQNQALPIHTTFNFPSPLPPFPQGLILSYYLSLFVLLSNLRIKNISKIFTPSKELV